MSNFMDYISWRGDLSLSQVPFSNVDYLIMCRLSYIKFEGVVSGDFDQKPIALKEAAQKVIYLIDEDESRSTDPKQEQEVLRVILNNPRYQDFQIYAYVSIIEEESQEQFCGMTFLLPDQSVLIIFRGTDNTLIGWKENFNMAFCEHVPSQKDAMYYVNEVSRHFIGDIRIAGHSKGGNLALYAATFCDITTQERIKEVVNLDGPGFNEQLVADIQFQQMKPKTKTYVPQSSVVGMLLEHRSEFTIVKSDSIGVFQHDLLSWVVDRRGFVLLEELTKSSLIIDYTIKNWLSNMDRTQREKFIDGIYSILNGADKETIKELWDEKNTIPILKSIGKIDNETRGYLIEGLRLLQKSIKESDQFKKQLETVLVGNETIELI